VSPPARPAAAPGVTPVPGLTAAMVAARYCTVRYIPRAVPTWRVPVTALTMFWLPMLLNALGTPSTHTAATSTASDEPVSTTVARTSPPTVSPTVPTARERRGPT